MTRLLQCALLAAALAGACGGNSSSNTDASTNLGTGTQTNTSTSKSFTASCTMATNIGSGSVAVSFTVCHEYYNSSASAIQSSCTSKPGDTVAMTYSNDHCSDGHAATLACADPDNRASACRQQGDPIVLAKPRVRRRHRRRQSVVALDRRGGHHPDRAQPPHSSTH